jgi:HPt (histidine-containing phosphotransfer) domain-containing protein
MREKLEVLGVPYDEIMERFMGKEDFYRKMLKKFLEDKSFVRLEEASAAKDWHEVFVQAHTIKGLCANLGLQNIVEYAVPLTESVRNEPYTEDEINPLVEHTLEEYKKAVEVIEAL